ncbi:MAG: GIY-YIG nuclease family protein [Microgenomates group bacterium]
MIDSKIINKLPATFGVYFFKKNKEILYIGKSVNIKARVKSHLDNAKLDKKEALIVNQSDDLEWMTTENEFQALLLESQLIKKYQPKYNVIWKDDKSYLYIKITVSDDYPKIFLTRKKDIDSDKNKEKNLYFGPFSSVKVVESLISDIRHIIPFCTEKNLGKKPCFYSKIGLCQPCPNVIEKQKDKKIKLQLKKQYRKNIKKVIEIFQGKVIKILDNFYDQLKRLIKEEKFEEAINIRNKIFRLERLINQPLNHNQVDIENISLKILFVELKKYFPDLEKLQRIECYDISNLGKKNQVASMVVMTNGKLDKSQYRRFKIKNPQLKSDFDRLEEVINRRFENQWPKPDLLVIDGGRPQLKAVMTILKKMKIDIPLVGIAKNPDRLIIGQENFLIVKYPQTNQGFNLIRLMRDEAHRFAKKYHLYLRNRDFLI